MSEREQDALLDRFETAARRTTLTKRILIGALGVAVCAAAGAVLIMRL